MKFSPNSYQRNVIKFIVSKMFGAIFLAPGLGKTMCILESFRLLRAKGYVKTMLVIAPLRVVKGVWRQEAAKWDLDLSFEVLHGPDKQGALRRKADVYLINYEGLAWLATQRVGKGKFDMLYIDESSKIKNTSTQRFKVLKGMRDLFRRIYIGTGSPVPNGLLDLFGQMYIVDEGNALGRFVTHYRNNFFNATGYGGYTYVLQHGAAERIYERIRPVSVRYGNEELDMPDLVMRKTMVELPKDVRKSYLEMERDLITRVKSEEIVAANAASATSKLRQIVGGHAYNDGKVVRIHDAKIEALQDLVDELQGQPLLVGYEFVHELVTLMSVFKHAKFIGGSSSGLKADPVEDVLIEWNKGNIPVLFGQPASMAFGLNMQGVQAAVAWYSLTYNLELYEQLIQRVWRQGQKHTVVVHHLLAEDTIDESILETLGAKDTVQGNFLAAMSKSPAGKRKGGMFEALKLRADKVSNTKRRVA